MTFLSVTNWRSSCLQRAGVVRQGVFWESHVGEFNTARGLMELHYSMLMWYVDQVSRASGSCRSWVGGLEMMLVGSCLASHRTLSKRSHRRSGTRVDESDHFCSGLSSRIGFACSRSLMVVGGKRQVLYLHIYPRVSI